MELTPGQITRLSQLTGIRSKTLKVFFSKFSEINPELFENE